jgi:hypothetical protein
MFKELDTEGIPEPYADYSTLYSLRIKIKFDAHFFNE